MERADLAHRQRHLVRDHRDVIRAIEPAVRENLGLLVPIDRTWQPTDYLPDLEAGNWREEIERFRHRAEAISDELLVVLVGDMVTEKALLGFARRTAQGRRRDQPGSVGTGAPPWTAEENRHGVAQQRREDCLPRRRRALGPDLRGDRR